MVAGMQHAPEHHVPRAILLRRSRGLAVRRSGDRRADERTGG